MNSILEDPRFKGITPFENKLWLASPTMHGEEIKYVTEAYETNWMSTVGKNINEVERITCEKIGCKYAVGLSAGTASLHLAMKLAGLDLYGQPEVGKGALEGHKVYFIHVGTKEFHQRHFFAMIDDVFVDVDTYSHSPWGHANFAGRSIYRITEYPYLPLPKQY